MDTATLSVANLYAVDHPSWSQLQACAAHDDAEVRAAAIAAAPRCLDMPTPVLDGIADVALLGTGLTATWAPLYRALDDMGLANRFVAELFKWAGEEPLVVLVALLARSDLDWLTHACRTHPSTSVRTIAGSPYRAATKQDQELLDAI